MASIEDFESKLKEVVNAKRLSASKMEKLTELSIKLMENDTQLVSVLYRTHKSLPASAKISSLYVFDAICRAARSQTVKRNLLANPNAEKGNCATFLLKIDSVLDGLFQDVLSSGIPEAKEKTRKILDIWTKSNTFPTNVLTRLGAVDKAGESSDSGIKETKRPEAGSSTPVSDPRKQSTPPSIITPPPAPSSTTPTAEAAQAALLALLTSAASVKNPSNTNQNPVNQPAAQGVSLPNLQSQVHLELQAALLQQLSKNNNAAPTPGFPTRPLQNQAPPIPLASTSPFPARLNTSSANSNYAGPISPLSAGGQSYPGQGSRDPRTSRFDDTAHVRGRGERSTDDGHRGSNVRGYRGGFRGRGRGEFRGPNERGREAPWERGTGRSYENGPPPYRRRLHSRSRSPPPRLQAGRAGNNSLPGSPSTDRNRSLGPESLGPGKDEFGRDIRSGSEGPEADRGKRENIPTSTYGGDVHIETRTRAVQSVSERGFNTLTTNADTLATPKPGPVGLDSFDISTFDPTSAESWKALGNAFQVTNGYVPSQEELMYVVMSSMGTMMGAGTGVNQNGATKGVDGAGGITDLNGNFGGVDEAMQGDGNRSGWCTGVSASNSSNLQTDAVVLGQNAEDQTMKGGSFDTNAVDTPVSAINSTESVPVGSTGKMQKVGDRWVFIRSGV